MSRTTRRRISSSATTVTACWRISRSNSPSAAGVADRDEPRLRAARGVRRDRQRERAARDLVVRRARRRRRARSRCAARPPRDRLERRGRELAPERRCGHHLAARSRTTTAPPIAADERARHLVEPALLEHELLEPPLERDAALERLVLLVDEARRTPSR